MGDRRRGFALLGASGTIAGMNDTGQIAGVAGVVLCGGQSRRMGRPKAGLPFGEELLLPRVVRILSEVVWPIAVVAAPDQPLPQLPEEVIIARDRVAGRGPLQGLAAGLGAVAPHADAAYVSACDAPFLRPAFVRAVIAGLSDHDIAVPVADGFHQTLAAAYRCRVLSDVEALLAEDRLRPLFLFQRTDTHEIPESALREVDPELASLRNLNSPEEYEAALRRRMSDEGGRTRDA